MEKQKDYKKPRITKVSLLPEETLLTGCKQSSGPGGKSEKCYPVSGGCKTTSGS